MSKSSCAQCKNSFSLWDFNSNKITSININKIQTIYLHDSCEEDYIEENQIFYCEQCYSYDYKKGVRETTNYFVEDGDYYHKKCFPDKYCYKCQKFVTEESEEEKEEDNFVTVYSSISCDGYETKDVVFHKECINNFDDICVYCNKAEQSKCILCKTSKAYGCLNGCEYGYGTWEYCDDCR